MVRYQTPYRYDFAGSRNLQFDDCTWGAIAGDAAKQRYKKLGQDLDEVKREFLEVNNLALEGKPEDMVITSHICRGNYHSTFFTSGPYDTVADYVFARENVNALFLEHDDAKSGGFASCEIGNKLTEEAKFMRRGLENKEKTALAVKERKKQKKYKKISTQVLTVLITVI